MIKIKRECKKIYEEEREKIRAKLKEVRIVYLRQKHGLHEGQNQIYLSQHIMSARIERCSRRSKIFVISLYLLNIYY